MDTDAGSRVCCADQGKVEMVQKQAVTGVWFGNPRPLISTSPSGLVVFVGGTCGLPATMNPIDCVKDLRVSNRD